MKNVCIQKIKRRIFRIDSETQYTSKEFNDLLKKRRKHSYSKKVTHMTLQKWNHLIRY
jgi:hypothetical protein